MLQITTVMLVSLVSDIRTFKLNYSVGAGSTIVKISHINSWQAFQ